MDEYMRAYQERYLSQVNSKMKQSDSQEFIAQEPYYLQENWLTPPIASIKENPIASPVYQRSGHKWRLVLYPKGDKQNTHISVYLMKCKCTEEHAVLYNFKVVGNKTIEHGANYCFNKEVFSKGKQLFIPLESLDDYLVNGCLQFMLTIKFSPPVTFKNQIDYRKKTGFIGLKNIGATCYMNSLLQHLFHLPVFRRVVYNFQTSPDYEVKASVALAIQRLFIKLQCSPISISTYDFVDSLGWKSNENFFQQDCEEFLRFLLINLKNPQILLNLKNYFKLKHVQLDQSNQLII